MVSAATKAAAAKKDPKPTTRKVGAAGNTIHPKGTPVAKKATAPRKPKATTPPAPEAPVEKPLTLTERKAQQVEAIRLHARAAGLDAEVENGVIVVDGVKYGNGKRKGWDGWTVDDGPVMVAGKIVAAHYSTGTKVESATVKGSTMKVTVSAPKKGKLDVPLTRKEYDAEIAKVDASDLDSRRKAAAKAVLTARARRAGLEVAGARKATDTMTPAEITERRKAAAAKAVATRQARSAALLAASAQVAKGRKAKAS